MALPRKAGIGPLPQPTSSEERMYNGPNRQRPKMTTYRSVTLAIARGWRDRLTTPPTAVITLVPGAAAGPLA